DRDPLLRAVLRQLAADYTAWGNAGGDPKVSGLHAAYTEVCDTLGRQVVVSLPGGDEVTGLATGVDADGRLVLRAQDGTPRTGGASADRPRPPGTGQADRRPAASPGGQVRTAVPVSRPLTGWLITGG